MPDDRDAPRISDPEDESKRAPVPADKMLRRPADKRLRHPSDKSRSR